MLNSGMKDKNSVEIKDGDTVRITLEVQNSKPIVKDCKVWYEASRAAFMCDWSSGNDYLGGFYMEKTTFEVI